MLSATAVLTLLVIPWILFFVVWTGSIIYEAVRKKVKKIEKREPAAVLILTRLFLYISIVLVFANDAVQDHYPFGLRFLPHSSTVLYLGFALSMAGIIFSVWGRIVLGSNWSADAVLKSGQTLVSRGPYALVRNPIYTGITLGMIGSAVALGNVGGLLAVALILVFSFLRITYEEKMMKEKFGEEWDSYAGKVKRFIPWVW